MAPGLLEIKGIGPKTAERLAAVGISEPVDLLYLLPRRYDDYRIPVAIASLKPGQRVLTQGTVVRTRSYGRPWRRILEVVVEHQGATLRGIWFTHHRPKPDRFVKGTKIYLTGLVSTDKSGGLQIAHPVILDHDDTTQRIGRILPVYPKIAKVKARTVENAVQWVATRVGELVNDSVPREFVERHGLSPLAEALRLVHLPPTETSLANVEKLARGDSPAHRRLIYDEFFFLQLALALRRKRRATQEAPTILQQKEGLAQELGSHLGFTPTGAQVRVIGEIVEDMARPAPMQRLLQGDVGSGKTFVALAAVIGAVRGGFQAALMAPTEILAEQHMRTIHPILERMNIRAVLHTGSLSTAAREENLSALADGTAKVAIGTHALIQGSMQFHHLGLAIVDEQHRFGVSQRLSLVGKGPEGLVPHLLVMTATPIPRTLALTVHGDLDISVLNELPPGRPPVFTKVWSQTQRQDVLNIISCALDRGEQVYVVCPTIENSNKLKLTSVETVFRQLCKRFGAERTGLLHGRLPQGEKETVMADFVRGRTPLLVATTVVEVGVDVAKATVMVIENAERFGLAQLHQLRGRVGRSPLASACHLVADPKNPDAFARLEVLSRTSDGFEISEADLSIRGPGEIYGRLQAGLPSFRFADLARDGNLLTAARNDAFELLNGNRATDRATLSRLHAELAHRMAKIANPIGEEAG